MNLEINDKVIEVKFTIGAIEALDKIYEVQNGGAKFGMGISSSIVYLKQYNPVVLRNIIEALQAGKPKVGRSELEVWLLTQDIEKLCNDFMEELGKQDLTKAMVKNLNKQAKKIQDKQ
ncbi:tail assembly chaperone [Enterococcus alishanensis]